MSTPEETKAIVTEFLQANNDMHSMYGSTAVCYGGVGGAAMTAHCAHICHNPLAHEKEQDRWRDAYLAIREEFRI